MCWAGYFDAWTCGHFTRATCKVKRAAAENKRKDDTILRLEQRATTQANEIEGLKLALQEAENKNQALQTHANVPENACGLEDDYVLENAYVLEDTGSSENDFGLGNAQALADILVPGNDLELEKLFMGLEELNQSSKQGSENGMSATQHGGWGYCGDFV
ncbi:hypothetical protein B0A49_06851 [Cryomyces minteri]|uniref:Uncharacterized protein n=1 Tax=Cryomyces minteri TaxID=331657 RepID=A0A4U0X9W6_9PEZI|nr:hypothetical protein B0A49_06851 [Cryomyces minteri]